MQQIIVSAITTNCGAKRAESGFRSEVNISCFTKRAVYNERKSSLISVAKIKDRAETTSIIRAIPYTKSKLTAVSAEVMIEPH